MKVKLTIQGHSSNGSITLDFFSEVMESVKLQFLARSPESTDIVPEFFCEHLFTSKHKTKLADLSCQILQALFFTWILREAIQDQYGSLVC